VLVDEARRPRTRVFARRRSGTGLHATAVWSENRIWLHSCRFVTGGLETRDNELDVEGPGFPFVLSLASTVIQIRRNALFT